MIGLAVAIAFVSSVAGSLTERLVTLLISVPVLQSLPASQRGIVHALVGYWFPAALIYLALRVVPFSQRLILTRGQTTALLIANVVFTLYITAKIVASTVEGGGASYAVAILSIFTALPAVIVMSWVIMKVAVQSFRRTPKIGTRLAPNGFSSARSIVAFLLLGLGPVAAGVATLMVGKDSPFQRSRTAQQRMQDFCKTAGETIGQVPQHVQGLYLDEDWTLSFEQIEAGIYGPNTSGLAGISFVNQGMLRFFETPTRTEPRPVGIKPLHYERYDLQQKKQIVTDLIAEYGLFRTKLTLDEDDWLKTQGYELTIKKLMTGEIIATHRFFFNRLTRQICGKQNALKSIDENDFIRRALGLERKRFESPA